MTVRHHPPTGNPGHPDIHARRVADAPYAGVGIYVGETEALWRESLHEIEPDEDDEEVPAW